MGGEARLRAITRARFELVDQGLRIALGPTPPSDGPSYESHSELRDYTRSAWRNTRRFPQPAGAPGAAAWLEVVDVVRDSVAVRRRPPGPGGVASPAVLRDTGWAPLNVAYVDERNERFAFAPERVLLAVRSAADLRALPDTAVAGVPHARLAATLGGVPVVLFVRRGDGFPALVRYRAAQPNDFGLAGYGVMDVEHAWSRWQRTQDGVVYPMQWDVRRLGRPYLRTTVVALSFAAPAPADSFAVSDSLRAAYVAETRRPMHDLPLDSARFAGPRLVAFNTPGAPAGAVRLGRHWLLLEAGTAPSNAERASAWLARHDTAGGALAGALVTLAAGTTGGVAWLAARGTPVYAAPAAAPFVRAALAGQPPAGRPPAPAARVEPLGGAGRVGTAGGELAPGGRWLRVDGDSLWAEPVALPDAPGAVLVYVPSLRWAYAATAVLPLHLDLVRARIQGHGWDVTRLGTLRGMTVPLTPAPAGGP